MKVDKVKVATKLKNKANLVVKLNIGVQLVGQFIVSIGNGKIVTKLKNKSKLVVKVLKPRIGLQDLG